MGRPRVLRPQLRRDSLGARPKEQVNAQHRGSILFEGDQALYESDSILIESGLEPHPLYRFYDRIPPWWSTRTPWRASFPWDNSRALPRLGDELRLALEDGRSGRARVTEVVQDLERPDPWIECVGVEPLTGGA